MCKVNEEAFFVRDYGRFSFQQEFSIQDRCVYTHRNGWEPKARLPASSIFLITPFPTPCLCHSPQGALGLPELQLETFAQDKAARGCSIPCVHRLLFGEVCPGTLSSFWLLLFLLLQQQMCYVIH